MGGPGTIDGAAHPETDNFAECEFSLSDETFHSAEQYFQWTKCVNDVDRQKILNGGIGADVWNVGNSVALRPDWEIVKVNEMMKGNRAKFEQNQELKEALVATRGKIEFVASSPFWCRWNGLIMERLRAEFRLERGDYAGAEGAALKEKDTAVAAEIATEMAALEKEGRDRLGFPF
jgi:ribA/ribD-fused uncharacterized protein